jgi:hypothetical protein
MSVVPDNREPAPPTVYQLRVVYGISPLFWRRLLLRADTTIADLHNILQTAFGWGGEHLHRFVIHGVEYGISYAGGVGFRDDPHRIRLAELGLRRTERFVYDYDSTDGWRLDLRLERVLAVDPGRVYPCCIGGRRAARRRTAAGRVPSSSRPSLIMFWRRPSVRPRSWACSSKRGLHAVRRAPQ